MAAKDRVPGKASVDRSSCAADPRSAFLALLRPSQWVKNIVVFAGPAAGLKLSSADSLNSATLTFAAFCLAASSSYVLNDIFDREADRSHPTKRNRPVAAGRIGVGAALATAGVLLAGCLTVATLFLPLGVTVVLAFYWVMTLVYSAWLKERVILDVIVIAVGFVLRALAGSLAVGVPASEWLVACVFTLCLFMGFGKRRCEIAMIGDAENISRHRHTLVRYTPDLLNHLLTVSAGITIITFLLYTLDAQHPAPFHKEHLFYTLPLVVYGVFRFAMLTELGAHTGPTEIVLRDRAILLTIILWTACALVVAYQSALFGPQGLSRFFGLSSADL
jgi:4-hydroxybenzoate polyprenyltransferase